jgi:hypothetical protein
MPDVYKKDIEMNRKEIEKYCCLLNFTAITGRYIMGTLYDQGRIKAYVADRNSRKLYTITYHTGTPYPEMLSNMSHYTDNQFITFIYPGKYEDLDSENLPPEVREHIENENFTICLNRLK